MREIASPQRYIFQKRLALAVSRIGPAPGITGRLVHRVHTVTGTCGPRSAYRCGAYRARGNFRQIILRSILSDIDPLHDLSAGDRSMWRDCVAADRPIGCFGTLASIDVTVTFVADVTKVWKTGVGYPIDGGRWPSRSARHSRRLRFSGGCASPLNAVAVSLRLRRLVPARGIRRC